MPFDPISYSLARKAFLRPIPPPSGVWEVLADVTLTVDSDFVDFTGLDINSDGAYRLIGSIRNPTGSETQTRLYVNADYTDTNYYAQCIQGSGTSVSAGRSNAPNIGNVGAGASSLLELTIVRNPASGKTIAKSIVNRFDGGSLIALLFTIQHQVSQTNVTELRIAVTVAGALGAGSRFILARVKRP